MQKLFAVEWKWWKNIWIIGLKASVVLKSNQQLVKSAATQWLIPGSILFSIFNNLNGKHPQQVWGQHQFEKSSQYLPGG